VADYASSIRRSPGSDPLVPQPLSPARKARAMAHPDVATMRKLQAQGKAMPPAQPGGRPRFNITDAASLRDAILAIGRVRPNTDAARAKVRIYVMSRAKALGLISMIPGTWLPTGYLKSSGSNSGS
jgi:hypothetical protein